MKPIPCLQEPESWEHNQFDKEEFICVTAGGRIDVQMQYPRLGYQHSESRCLMRKGVYERLLNASELLPEGIRIRILDAWRPFALQEELYNAYAGSLVKQFCLEDEPEEIRNKVIEQYISFPNNCPELPPVHTTGGAVDVTLVDCNGLELDMGTGFDDFSEKAHTAYYENGGNNQVRDNRRLLYDVMMQAGFTNLPSEWWHYDFGDRFWAYYKDCPAVYRGVFTQEELYGEWNKQGRSKGITKEEN